MSQTALSQFDQACPPRRRSRSRSLTLTLLFALALFIASFSFVLHGEYRTLQNEWRDASGNVVIGYPGIQPRISAAERPHDWYHVSGEFAKLWGGWRHGFGHQWFLAEPGDVSPDRLSLPEGRDVNRAIDFPIVEFNGGTIWERLPQDADVAGSEFGGVFTAYPMLVLDRVYVVNDQIRDQPFLVTYNPRGSPAEKLAVFEPVVEGEQLSMGVSGYFHDDTPMLYDRGTESLWIRDGETLRAITGKHRGRKLRQICRPAPVSWDRWRGEHPEGRLVVGADRERSRR